MKEIISQLQGRAVSPLPADGAHGVTRPINVPIIAFSLGTHGNWNDLIATGANVIGIDWQTSLAEARKLIPENIGLQGNLPPSLISDATPEVVARETKIILETMRGRAGHIFNLGHGLTPGAKLENIAALVATVKGFK
jgi:uroporphyrinogen decarboxylase